MLDMGFSPDFRLIVELTPLNRHILFFFFNDTATTEIYTNLNPLSLHDALPILSPLGLKRDGMSTGKKHVSIGILIWEDRKSTRLNSSHIQKSRMPSSA